ncbi:MAG: hypothetical protein AB8G99_15405 [Planctomycetaceae bacterium]
MSVERYVLTAISASSIRQDGAGVCQGDDIGWVLLWQCHRFDGGVLALVPVNRGTKAISRGTQFLRPGEPTVTRFQNFKKLRRIRRARIVDC